MNKTLFFKSLASAIPQYCNDILVWLYNFEVSKLVTQYLYNAALIYQHAMELNHWNTVARMSGPTLDSLSSECRKFTRQNYIHWDYPQTMKNISYRQHSLQNRLNQYTTMSRCYVGRISYIGLSKEATVALDRASNTMIKNNLQNYSTKLTEKLLLLQFDMEDIQLVRSFYAMLPNHEQVPILCRMKNRFMQQFSLFQKEAARSLWRLKHKSAIRATTQLRLSSQGAMEKIEADAQIHFANALNKSQRLHDQQMHLTILARLDNVEKRNQQLLQFQRSNF